MKPRQRIQRIRARIEVYAHHRRISSGSSLRLRGVDHHVQIPRSLSISQRRRVSHKLDQPRASRVRLPALRMPIALNASGSGPSGKTKRPAHRPVSQGRLDPLSIAGSENRARYWPARVLQPIARRPTFAEMQCPKKTRYPTLGPTTSSALWRNPVAVVQGIGPAVRLGQRFFFQFPLHVNALPQNRPASTRSTAGFALDQRDQWRRD